MSLATFILLAPMILLWILAILDVLDRGDLTVGRKFVMAAVMLVFLPAAIVYLIARPTSVVHHGNDQERDWRDDLMDRLDGDPVPVDGFTDPELRSRVDSAVALEPTRADRS